MSRLTVDVNFGGQRVFRDSFSESDHPRKSGQFTAKGGGGSTLKRAETLRKRGEVSHSVLKELGKPQTSAGEKHEKAAKLHEKAAKLHESNHPEAHKASINANYKGSALANPVGDPLNKKANEAVDVSHRGGGASAAKIHRELASEHRKLMK